MISTPHLLIRRGDYGWYFRTLSAAGLCWEVRNYAAHQRLMDRIANV